MKRFVLAALAAVALAAGAGCGEDTSGPAEGGPTPFTPNTDGLFPFPDTPDNLLTLEGVALGRELFHDPILSGDSTQSCATCHLQTAAFADPRQFSLGIDGSPGTRNAPVLVNLPWSPDFFWAGRAGTLEDQAREPVPNPIEMNLPWDDAIPRLRAHASYPGMFAAAFRTEKITQDLVVMAIAQFERTLLSQDAKWDRVMRGEATFTAEERRGLALFESERAECFHCHGTKLFTDHRFHDNGLDAMPADIGREAVTNFPYDRGKFRTPSLRNVEVSAPYMHDGRFATLEEVIDHYSTGIQDSPNLDPLLRVIRPGAAFTAPEKADLLAFLRTLTDPVFLSNPDFGPPE
ncbi:cytochrome-c peroxidase [bacterium]|nr:cytochrome-c peroxidase [bacterium]